MNRNQGSNRAPLETNVSDIVKNKGINLTRKLLPLKIPQNIHQAYMCYDYEHLRKCFYRAVKQIDYKLPIEDINRDVLQLLFDEFNIFITKYQLTEGYFMATFNPHAYTDDAPNRSFDHKESMAYNEFDLEKFVRWFQRNLHKMRNFNKYELETYTNKKLKEKGELPPPPETASPQKQIPLSEQQKRAYRKIRDRRYKDLLSALDFEKRFRRDVINPQILD
jgi:hypothetical protein